MIKTVVASGYFNPLHIGHLHYLRAARSLGDKLTVIVNNDKQCQLKGSIFMNEQERMEIVRSVNVVNDVVLSIDTDESVCQTLNLLKPAVFAKGGDSTPDNIPELSLCRKLGIKTVFGVGGDKIQSSSNLLHKKWGYSKIMLSGKGWWFKRLIIDGLTSCQSHKERDEIFLIYVPAGIKHQIKGKGNIFELAVGNPREEDIERF